MKKPDTLFWQQCPLFRGIDHGESEAVLGCLRAVRRSYPKGDVILAAGDAVTSVGVVVGGQVHVVQEDFWGDRTILAGLGSGGLFAEAFACAGVPRMPVSVVAVEPADILFLDYQRIVTPCTPACGFHSRLIQNMLGILADKNVGLTGKLWHVTRRSTREKLLSYLSAVAAAAGSDRFDIPFSRQELADYLAVDRSAMSAELSRMRRDGLLTYDRNRFELLRSADL